MCDVCLHFQWFHRATFEETKYSRNREKNFPLFSAQYLSRSFYIEVIVSKHKRISRLNRYFWGNVKNLFVNPK
jgi:hypothetical protein